MFATLIAYDNETAVLQKATGELLSLKIAGLSEEDQEFLRKKSESDDLNWGDQEYPTWTMASGLKVQGAIVDFARKTVKIGWHRGRIYVNDRIFGNLPEIYQKMIPRIVSHEEKKNIPDEEALQAFLKRIRSPLQYDLQGVLMELENGDRYGVPFFFFSESDQQELRPGWERWLGANDDFSARSRESLYLQAQVQANQQSLQQMKQVAEMSLFLQGYNAGAFDMWEVSLSPPGGGYSRVVVVPGNDSRQATNNALAKYPNARVNGVAKVRSPNRRFRR